MSLLGGQEHRAGDTEVCVVVDWLSARYSTTNILDLTAVRRNHAWENIRPGGNSSIPVAFDYCSGHRYHSAPPLGVPGGRV